MIDPRLDTLEECYPAEAIRNLDARDGRALEDFLRRADSYLEQTLDGLNSLRHAVETDDVSRVRRLAGRLDKSSELVRATPMQDLAAALGGRARDARSTWGLDESVNELWTEFDRLRTSVRAVKAAVKAASSGLLPDRS